MNEVCESYANGTLIPCATALELDKVRFHCSRAAVALPRSRMQEVERGLQHELLRLRAAQALRPAVPEER